MSQTERTDALSDDEAILAVAREGFLEEADLLLRQFEDALLGLEVDPQDGELLNAAFRAAHTIKGTAGLFGCDAVVAFTHGVETLMEALRSGELAVSEPIFAALLASRDQMERLLNEVRRGCSRIDECDPEVQALSRSLGATLKALRQGDASAAAVHDVAADLAEDLLPETAPAAQAGVGSGAVSGLWHLSLRFGPDALRNGLDPLSFIRYLDSLGEVRHIATLAPALPPLEDLDAETCHLGFEIRYDSVATRETLEAVFEFVMEDCSLALLAPEATPADYDALLQTRCSAFAPDTAEHADACAALLGLWREQGVPLTLRPVAHTRAPSAATAPAAGPVLAPELAAARPVDPAAIERRTDTPERRAQPAERRAGSNDRRGDDTRYLRVSADKLDRLIDLIGELVIAGSGAQLVAQRERSPEFLEASLRIHDLVQEARDSALGLRMVPIGETFARFQRVVRDVSKALGKDVELQITGGDTEMDKSMVETIADPLMHLVRNSMDHGIEGAEERVARGKPARGRLALNAYHESGQIVIEVSDDGRGLDRERIVRKALERGLVASDQNLTDHEVHQLICHPGFSTAEQVTDISGRGVGMDVVKRNIESLRGQMQLASTAGAGTTTQIRLPLTLAIIDGFLIEVDAVHYVVPLERVVECLETPPEYHPGTGTGTGTREAHHAAGHFHLRGEVLPYLDLRRHFGCPPAPEGQRQSLLLVRSVAGKVGLLVDRLHGEHQTVIKPMAAIFRDVQGVSGSTILGSGDVALILDVSSLIEQCIRQGQSLRLRRAA
jgi:two-component system, chemotaxis family, sensor kinase CheA